MIERFYLKEYLSFKEAELNFNAGLVVFTGPSGSGKSILMNSILSSFGSSTCDASLCESSVNWNVDYKEFGIESDDFYVFKYIKKDKSRYLVNNQSISKKSISSIAKHHLRHLSLKDYSDFKNENLLSIIDDRISSKSKEIIKIKKDYAESFFNFKDVSKKLKIIEEEEKNIQELKEFAIFEIKKIDDINPQINEDEELMNIKKELSKKEKVLGKISEANIIFDNEHYVFSVLDSIDVDKSFFEDTMNELRIELDKAEEKYSSLEDVDIETILNRIEELGGLKHRYGSIGEALIYRDKKKVELEKYKNIENEKTDLENIYNESLEDVKRLSLYLSELRKKELKHFSQSLNKYLQNLYLKDAEIEISNIEYSINGIDEISIKLNTVELSKISTGEFNRLRLAILALKSENMNSNGGVLMLDEIDANLSGEESMSVAKVLRQVSKNFQILVISHQPQLTSMGEQHFLIYKDNEISKVKELVFDEKVDEIARIISGETISKEAKIFAKELLEANSYDD